MSDPQVTTYDVPVDFQSEEAVIGSVLINPDVYSELYFLKPADFYIHRNRWAWEAFAKLDHDRTPIDLLSVENVLKDRGQYAEFGGLARLTELVNRVPMSLNAEHYARRVEAFAYRRKVITAANQMATLAYDLKSPLDDVINGSLATVYAAVDRQSHKEVTIGRAMLEAFQQSEAAARSGKLLGIPSGFVDLDALLSGFKKGKLYYVGGRPGKGKTALVLDFGISAAFVHKKRVRIFSQEMNYLEIAIRVAAKELEIDTQRIEEGALSMEEWQAFKKLVDALQDYQTFPITIDETVPLHPNALNAICMNQYMRGNLDMVIIDYMQLMEGDGNNIREQVTHISRNAKRLSRTLNIPVIGAAQLSRNAAEGKPQLRDLQETGALEQDADVVMLLSDHEQEDLKSKGVMTADVSKHRGGPTGLVDLLFKREYTKFVNAATKRFAPNETKEVEAY